MPLTSCVSRCRLLFGQVFTVLLSVMPYVRHADEDGGHFPFISNFIMLTAHGLHQVINIWRSIYRFINKQCRMCFLSQRVVNSWNLLPQEVVDAQSLEVFKNRLDKFMGNNELGKSWLLTQSMKSDDDDDETCIGLVYVEPVTINFAPRAVVAYCHLANLMTWCESRAPSVLRVRPTWR